MSDIIIVDEEFKAVVEQIKTEGKETDEAVQKLIDVFTRITEEVTNLESLSEEQLRELIKKKENSWYVIKDSIMED